MLNGSTLKICFLMIVTTLCLIVLFLIIGIVFCHFDLTTSKEIFGMLGISALFGMISQAFIHSNIAEALKPDDNTTLTKTTTEIKDAPKTIVP
jgi:hypothetical protein